MFKRSFTFGFEERVELGNPSSLITAYISTDFIKRRKVVQLDDLGAHFNLKIHEVVERIESLQEEGTINGVIDDRGKFIYISEEELKSVAK